MVRSTKGGDGARRQKGDVRPQTSDKQTIRRKENFEEVETVRRDVRRSDSQTHLMSDIRRQKGGVLCTTKTRMVIRVSQYCGPLRIRRQR